MTDALRRSQQAAETEMARAQFRGGQSTLRLRQNWDENAVLNGILSGDHFEKNIANEFNNLAYHWRLFAMQPKNFLIERSENDEEIVDILDFYRKVDSHKQVTIAETGVTGFNIADVEFSQHIADIESRASVTTEISMKITEPNGVGFLDGLVRAAHDCGIQSYTDFYYYLELTFRGYDQIGRVDTEPFRSLPNGGRWMWGVQITGIEANMGSGGGVYRLKMFPLDGRALVRNSEYGMVLDTTYVQANTIGEFFDELTDKMNLSWKERFGNKEVIKHKFQFHGLPGTEEQMTANAERDAARQRINQGSNTTDDILRSIGLGDNLTTNIQDPGLGDISAEAIRLLPLRPQEADWSSLRSAGMTIITPTTDEEGVGAEINRFGIGGSTPNADNAPTAHIPAGTTIPNLVNTVFSSCERAQCLARDTSGANLFSADDGDGVNDHGFRESVTWRVIPEVQVKSDFDPLSYRYHREVIWHLYPTIAQDPILSLGQVTSARLDPEGRVQRGMLAALGARGFLPKRYDYLFSGINTEVLNFDLNFNLAWSIMLPRVASYYNDQPLNQALHNPNTEPSGRQEVFGDPLGRLQTANSDLRRLREELAALNTQVNEDGTVTEEEAASIDAKRQEIRTATERRNQADQEVQRAREQLSRDMQPPPEIEQDYSRAFVETLLDDLGTVTPERSNSMTFPPFSVTQTGGAETRHQVGHGMVGQYHPGKTFYGAVMNQLYGPTEQFQTIQLDIRGDPFWLPQGSFELALLHRETAHPNLPHILHGNPHIMLRFKYPSDVGSDGRVVLNANEVVTGIYKITQIKTQFVGGMWKHSLTGIRLPLIDLIRQSLNLPEDGSAPQNSQAEDTPEPSPETDLGGEEEA